MKNYLDLNDYEVIYMISEDDDIAKDIMFKKYEPIIRKEASRYYNSAKKLGLELDDLIQEGYMAISSSIKNFDSNKGILFYTYVKTAINRKMANLIRVNSGEKYRPLNETISLDANVSSDASLFSFIEDKNEVDPLSRLESNELINKIKQVLYELDIQAASILELRINGFKHNEISDLLCSNRRVITNIWAKVKRNLNLLIEN